VKRALSTLRVKWTNPPERRASRKFGDVKFYQVVRLDPAKSRVVAKS
jgi:hypothetical protein